jgi:ABC-type iron transport system FetAB ATPase subunit
LPVLKIEQLSNERFGPVDLVVNNAESVCISGASGSGKSTLLRAVADLDPHQGRVWLDDEEQHTIPAPQWRSRLGLLAAESYWWFDDVRLHFSHIEDVWFELLGFDLDVLDWQVSRLSSGERQRLALLRLLCHKPDVLLLDEPSANLDRENSRRVEQLIDSYQQHNAAPVLWISHDPEQIERIARRHYRIVGGRLQEAGT